MRHRVIVVGVLVILMPLVMPASAQEDRNVVNKELPPCVVKTEPANRATDVAATLNEIKVTYDRKMTDRMWSWIIQRNLGVYPGGRDLGEPRWENDGKTCVLPVRLRPNTVYAIGCNSFRHNGFRDLDGKVAVPHVLVFKTKAPE